MLFILLLKYIADISDINSELFVSEVGCLIKHIVANICVCGFVCEYICLLICLQAVV